MARYRFPRVLAALALGVVAALAAFTVQANKAHDSLSRILEELGTKASTTRAALRSLSAGIVLAWVLLAIAAGALPNRRTIRACDHVRCTLAHCGAVCGGGGADDARAASAKLPAPPALLSPSPATCCAC